MESYRNIKLSLHQAKEIYGVNEEVDKELNSHFSEGFLDKVKAWEGKWIINLNEEDGDHIFFCERFLTEDAACGYGFNRYGKWWNLPYESSSRWIISDKSRIATQKEIKDSLLDFANKKYKVGQKVKDVKGQVFTMTDGVYVVDVGDILIRTQSNGTTHYLYSNGQWADIIKEAPSKIFVPKEIGIHSFLMLNNKKRLVNSWGQILGTGKGNYYVSNMPEANQNTGDNFFLVECKKEDIKKDDVFFVGNPETSDLKKLALYNICLEDSSKKHCHWFGEGVTVSELTWECYYKVVHIND